MKIVVQKETKDLPQGLFFKQKFLSNLQHFRILVAWATGSSHNWQVLSTNSQFPFRTPKGFLPPKHGDWWRCSQNPLCLESFVLFYYHFYLKTLMSQIGTILRFSQLRPLRPRHTDQLQLWFLAHPLHLNCSILATALMPRRTGHGKNNYNFVYVFE